MRATRPVRTPIAALLCLALAACGGPLWNDPPAKLWNTDPGAASDAPPGSPLPDLSDAPPRPPLPDFSDAPLIGFEKVLIALPRGTPIGQVQLHRSCRDEHPLVWEVGTAFEDPAPFSGAFEEELARAGFPTVPPSDLLFETRGPARDLVAGAVIDRLEAFVCFPDPLHRPRKQRGHGTVDVTWQIYSRSRGRVVFKGTATGSGKLPEGSDTGVLGITLAAFADATRDLLADPAFQAFLADRGAPEGTDALPALAIDAPPVSETPLKETAAALRKSVVTLLVGNGHGSGFVVDPRGLVLTNAHVVGDVRLVTVRLVTGRELVGEVLRSEAGRDVALVQLEEGRLPALPIRTDALNVGEEVYAVGAPLEPALQTTVTRGIVSGYRQLDGLRYIQSDVNIQPGNSGGPLLDERGNVVGISVQGFVEGGSMAGLNLFIPVTEALESLRLERTAADGAGP